MHQSASTSQINVLGEVRTLSAYRILDHLLVLWLTAMITLSNWNIFRFTGALCGNPPVTGDFPPQRPVMRSFEVFFDLLLNKCLSKQPGHRWFETQSRSLSRQCNALIRCNCRACHIICFTLVVYQNYPDHTRNPTTFLWSSKVTQHAKLYI